MREPACMRALLFDMNKDQKAAVVDEIAERLADAKAIFAIDYRGISVTEAKELRTRLAESETAFKVVKNRLAKRAVEEAGPSGIGELFEGPTALALVKGDPVVAAKAISAFAREHEVLEFKGGVMDGQALDPEGFRAIARLPGLEALHGQLVGLAASPLTGLVRGLGSMLSGLALALGQVQEKGLFGGAEEEEEEEAQPPPEAEAAADEPEAVAAGPADQPEAETQDNADQSPEEAEGEAGGGDGPEEE